MENLEHIVTIVSFEEFNQLIDDIGKEELAIMELIDSIARINSKIYEQTNTFGQS
tara:strand:- start:2809 stop:2973 length:165 start_codon:yes stop_codon:yes gene_type:complete